jgi:hypothetical protein
MARGIWSGIASGLAQVQERKRLEQERQDRLGLIAQERQDKLDERRERREMFDLTRSDSYFNNTLEYIKSGDFGGVTKSSTPTGANAYVLALKKWDVSDEEILRLAEAGPKALELAYEDVKKNLDSNLPLRSQELSLIVENILSAPGVTPSREEAVASLESSGVDITRLNEQQREILLTETRKKLTTPSSTISANIPKTNLEIQDIAGAETAITAGINSLLISKERGLDKTTKEGLERGAAIGAARDYLKAGDPSKAFNILIEDGGSEFTRFYEQYVASFPNFFSPDSSVPLYNVGQPTRDLYIYLKNNNPTTEENTQPMPRRIRYIVGPDGELVEENVR